MIQQTTKEPETGIPREGCLFYVYLTAPFWWAGMFPGRPTETDVDRIYADCLSTLARVWIRDHFELRPTIQIRKRPDGVAGLNINNPGMILHIARSYADIFKTRLVHEPDKEMHYLDEGPWDYSLVATAVEWKRPSDTNHWVLMDKFGWNLIFNPDRGIPLETRTGRWRPIAAA